MPIRENVTRKIQNAPSTPGVYTFRDGRGRPIYIGKARSLANRLRSYLQRALPEKTHAMLAAARDLDWIVFRSDFEAILAEASMIRRFRPRYNIALRDDKRHPMILLTNEPYPKLLKIRRPRPGRGRHYGPFPTQIVHHLLEIASREFHIRRCNGPLPKRNRPCIDYDLGRCEAPCVGLIGADRYAESVEKAARLLGGETQEIIEMLKSEMKAAADRRDYESAAELRDAIAGLRRLRDLRLKQAADRPERGDLDALGWSLDEGQAAVVLLRRRGGAVADSKVFLYDLPVETNTEEILLRTILEASEAGLLQAPLALAATQGEPKAPEELQRVWRKLTGRSSRIRIPRRGPDAALTRLAEQNAVEALRLARGERTEAARNAALKELVELLDLDRIPLEIEGIDIATMSGRDTVGALVHFRKGLPFKTRYRKYRIRGRQDSDVDAVEEVVARRCNAREPLPQILLIDGGVPQLHAAISSLSSAYSGPPTEAPVVLALAKREERIHTADGAVLELNRSSHALRLLQQVRDEAHRFGGQYHRWLRSRGSRGHEKR